MTTMRVKMDKVRYATLLRAAKVFDYLCTVEKSTGEKLAEHFDVSIVTINRDIYILKHMGLPVRAEGSYGTCVYPRKTATSVALYARYGPRNELEFLDDVCVEKCGVAGAVEKIPGLAKSTGALKRGMAFAVTFA